MDLNIISVKFLFQNLKQMSLNKMADILETTFAYLFRESFSYSIHDALINDKLILGQSQCGKPYTKM